MENKKNIEQNFNEVEKIIEAMQKEDVTLDESFKLYNQGLNHTLSRPGKLDYQNLVSLYSQRLPTHIAELCKHN